MNFQVFKDNAGAAAMTVIIGWSGAQLHTLNQTAGKLAEELVAMRGTQAFHAYRLDQDRDLIKEALSSVNENKIKIGRIELKIFEHSGQRRGF
jgi:hypothetical protein